MTEDKELDRKLVTLYRGIKNETRRDTMIRLACSIDSLTQEEISRLADIALGMALLKDCEVKKAS